MRIDPQGRAWLESEARLQLPATRDLETGRYSASDFVRYDLTDHVLDYLAEAFDVLEIIAPGRRRLRVENARTVESFDIIAQESAANPGHVMPIALSIWLHEPNQPLAEQSPRVESDRLPEAFLGANPLESLVGFVSRTERPDHTIGPSGRDDMNSPTLPLDHDALARWHGNHP